MCIGDVIEVGNARLQLSMPRQPCFRLNHRFEQPKMAQRVQQTCRTGWYYRVLSPGTVTAGDVLRVVERPHPEWTVSRVQHYLYIETDNHEAMIEIAGLTAIAPLIRDLFRKRLQSTEVENWGSRLVETSAVPVVGAQSEAAAPSPTDGWMQLQVKTITLESPTVRSFILVATDGQPLPPSQPGAHVRVRLTDGTTRHYSLCANSDGRNYKIAVALATRSRGGSRWLHKEINVGDVISVSAPLNSFSVAPDARQHIMIAAGIGITPFLSMIQHFQSTDARFRLYFLGRSEASTPFIEELSTLRANQVRFHFTDGDASKRLNVETALESLVDGTHVYCCGPRSLMEAVQIVSTKYPTAHFHYEAFSSSNNARVSRAFAVHLKSSGRSFEVAANQSILHALRANNVDVASSCETGSCGTCVVGFSGGSVAHSDFCLGPAEQASQLAVCVSRAVTDTLTLDL